MQRQTILGVDLQLETCHTVVIGAGAAGLNAADELKKQGIDVLLIAPSFAAGTSLNAGSDKQTFYKLSLSGDYGDAPAQLAQSYMAGGAMHGDTAYALAAGSARAFYKLVELGIPFPQNDLGEFVGYQTDHDASFRATSAGPLTSRFMAQKLMESCRSRNVRMIEGFELVSILSDKSGAYSGLLLSNKEDELLFVSSRCAVIAVGGPASVYEKVVYPASQTGATGAAVKAGLKMNNLCYWQYGLASTDVLWNVSGSYQQVIPAYVDDIGSHVLEGVFSNDKERTANVFRKGYQWPFDSRKLNGSSRVDQAVIKANAAGRHVYMDFNTNETGLPLEMLEPEAYNYLKNSMALQPMPIDRLRAMNEKAYEFYLSHGLDLTKEKLEVAVCAQHCNGGIAIDKWWQTSMPCLYAAGECAGAFGIYRPGGSALNETQVGSLRAAQHISAHHSHVVPDSPSEFFERNAEQITSLLREYLSVKHNAGGNIADNNKRLCADMSLYAGAVRDYGKMLEMSAFAKRSIEDSAAAGGRSYSEVMKAKNNIYAIGAILSSMLCNSALSGYSGHSCSGNPQTSDLLNTDWVVETQNMQSVLVPLRPLPEGGGWFERVWKKYLDNSIYD